MNQTGWEKKNPAVRFSGQSQAIKDQINTAEREYFNQHNDCKLKSTSPQSTQEHECDFTPNKSLFNQQIRSLAALRNKTPDYFISAYRLSYLEKTSFIFL